MNLCHDLHVPLHTYNKILKWALDSILSGYTFSTIAPSQTVYLKEFFQCFIMQNIKPKVASSELYPYKQADIVTFLFTEIFYHFHHHWVSVMQADKFTGHFSVFLFLYLVP